jgi:hypothetical protein
MPPSSRWRSRRGWPSLEREAKPHCPRLRKPARVLRKRPSRPAALSSWPPCAPAWGDRRRQGSAPPRGEAQAPPSAPASAFRAASRCTGAARGTAGEQRRPLACRQGRPSPQRTAPLPRPRPSGVRGVATVPSVRTATFGPSPSEVHAAARPGAPGQRRIRRSALPHPPSGRSPAWRRGRLVEVRRQWTEQGIEVLLNRCLGPVLLSAFSRFA